MMDACDTLLKQTLVTLKKDIVVAMDYGLE
jgi:hypothetical protein